MKKLLAGYLKKKTKVYSKALKPRRISLAKLPEALTGRHSARRLKCFFVAVDILESAEIESYSRSMRGGKLHYEVSGLDADGRTVVVHIREEKSKKDRVLFFISTFARK